jgi:hypothetical protein
MQLRGVHHALCLRARLHRRDAQRLRRRHRRRLVRFDLIDLIYRIASNRITYTALYCIESHHIISYRIASHHCIYRITSLLVSSFPFSSFPSSSFPSSSSSSSSSSLASPFPPPRRAGSDYHPQLPPVFTREDLQGAASRAAVGKIKIKFTCLTLPLPHLTTKHTLFIHVCHHNRD